MAAARIIRLPICFMGKPSQELSTISRIWFDLLVRYAVPLSADYPRGENRARSVSHAAREVRTVRPCVGGEEGGLSPLDESALGSALARQWRPSTSAMRVLESRLWVG